jgi:hypothetical protein
MIVMMKTVMKENMNMNKTLRKEEELRKLR